MSESGWLVAWPCQRGIEPGIPYRVIPGVKTGSLAVGGIKEHVQAVSPTTLSLYYTLKAKTRESLGKLLLLAVDH